MSYNFRSLFLRYIGILDSRIYIHEDKLFPFDNLALSVKTFFFFFKFLIPDSIVEYLYDLI